ncbi:Oxamate amidohydrolase proenzyme [Halomonadaceae bacterium LMG 33818]|uniref:gamma-glutamyltransferase family protein n=1 Tax=Cernens ardua TaxID=3402176 RepID=UPI003EDC8193
MLQSAQSTRGMVVAPHHLASQTGLSILREGGSAIDAMVAAAATIAVVYPHMNSLGGDGFWLIVPPEGEPIAIDASGPTGLSATLDYYCDRGYQQIPYRGLDAALTVPGTISGWQKAREYAERHHTADSLPLERLLADALTYARDGFPVSHSQSVITHEKRDELRHVPGFAETFLDNGETPSVHARFKQPALARTLETLARNGLDDFYRGELSQRLIGEWAELGGILTEEDLHQYQAKIETPLCLEHSMGKIYNVAPPTQGIVSELILGIADQLNIQNVVTESADYVHILVEATKRAFAIRDRYVTDPSRMTHDMQAFLTPEALAAEASQINMGHAAAWGSDKGPADTIWMGAIDAEGWSVSFIQSIYHEFGSGVVLKDAGIILQNRGASFSLNPSDLNVLAPGMQPFHTLNPAAACFHDGRRMVYGCMGGDGQPQTQSALFTRYALFNEGLQRAITAPRWLLGRTWGKSSMNLKLEDRFPPAVIEALVARGHDVELLASFSEVVGHAGGIVRYPQGILEGATDPRSNGLAAGF